VTSPPLTRRRLVPALTYATIFIVLAVGLFFVLPRGNSIVPAPQASPVGTVDAPGADCLGDRIASVQSGVFVDYYVAGTHGDATEDLGDHVMGGRIDADTGRGVLQGTCPPGTPLVGEALSFDAQVFEDGLVSGVLTVDGQTIEVKVAPTDPLVDGADAGGLEGAEILARVLLAVAVVIVAARLLGNVFRLINQPRVIGEIVAGILLGPSLVGLFWPEVTSFLFPSEVISVLQILAQFGLIFFMFLIGAELDHKMIRGSGHTALLVSHYSIVIPFTLGVAAALLIFPVVGSGNFTGFALFMGAAMAITAFPVLARILTDTGLHRTRLGALAITCAAVDDVTAWCILAVVVAIVKASGPGDAIVTVLLALGFLAFMVFVVRPLLARIAVVQPDRGRLGATIMSALFVALFLSAWATEAIGIHAIFGAFMFGAVLPRSHSIAAQITERLEDVTVLFLLPVFFAVVGLSTRVGLVSGSDLWVLTGLIIAIAIVGKIGGSVIAGLAAGETFRSSTVLGVLMNARGITEIVILTIGSTLGVISPALFTMMVLMALVTTFMTTPLLTVLYPRDQIEQDMAGDATREMMALGSRERRVMVGVTDPLTARPLLELAKVLRGIDDTPATIILASVVRPPGYEQVRANLSAMDDAAALAATALGAVKDRLEDEGLEVEVETAVGHDPATELVRLVERRGAGMILIGSHQAYLGFRPLGGIAGEILEEASCDVAVLVGAGTHRELGPGPLGVWYRGEPADFAALDLAASLARGLQRPVRVISPISVELPNLMAEVQQVVLTEPTVAHALEAVEGTSLMVVAPAGVLDGVLPALRESVMERASVPVLVVRGGQRPHLADALAIRELEKVADR
jgi:Kef-type K+ transport system membrane component KefB/nucleotide-binding universal stress UspA family protein